MTEPVNPAVLDLARMLVKAMSEEPMLLRELARVVVREMLEDPAFKQAMREIVLTVSAAQDGNREGYVRTLLAHCRQHKVKVEVNKAGAMIVTDKGKLSEQMRLSLEVYRPDIIALLKPPVNGSAQQTKGKVGP